MIIPDAYPIHLDGLLYWAISQFVDEVGVFQELDRILDQSHGVYRASQALYVKSNQFNLIPVFAQRATRTNWLEYDQNIGFTKAKKSIKEAEGVFVKRLDTFMAVQAKKIIMFAYGNAVGIKWFLDSLIGVGRQANAGFGEIDSVQIQSIQSDYSWFHDGRLNRVLPVRVVDQKLDDPIRNARYKPNYKTTEFADCYIPTIQTYKEVG